MLKIERNTSNEQSNFCCCFCVDLERVNREKRAECCVGLALLANLFVHSLRTKSSGMGSLLQLILRV